MRIAFGTDDSCATTAELRSYLADQGHEVLDAGDGTPWPEVGRAVATMIASRAADVGIVCCFTGTGVAIAANKVPGVRAALCTDAETARGARRWNDANVLAFGLRLTTFVVAREMVDAFLTTEVDAAELPLIGRLP